MGKNDGKMGDISEGGDSGELRTSYEGTFYGKMSVEKSTGDETADEAQRLILKSPTPLPGLLRLYDNVIELYNQVDDLAYHHSPITNCTFAKYYPSLDVFVYILKDARADTLEAWVIGVPAQVDGQKSIRREIDDLIEVHTVKHNKAKKASQKKAKGSEGKGGKGKKKKKKAAKKASVKTSSFDCFEGALLGSVSVGHGQNQTAATKCVQILTEHNAEPDGIFLQLEKHGIRMYEALTHDPWGSFPKKQIVYCTVAGPKKDHVCYTTHDSHLGIKTCHVLRCTNAPRANQVFTALKKFGVNTEEVEGATREESKSEEFGGFDEMDDPFEGVGERIDAPGNLFKRQIRRGTLAAVKAVGAGQFGEVYLAKMKQPDETKIDCAVKMLKDVKSQSDRDEFVHEAEVMLETAHVNVMGMLGVAVQQKPWLMVLDFMRYGDLQALVKAAPPKGVVITHQEMLTLSAGICNGMKYMESIGFAHCDLAARNILVADENVVKVADFGLTRRLRHRPRWVGPKMMKIPIRWSAVEVLDGREFSLKSDVWAFAITVWEIFSYGLTPYPTLRNAEVHRTLVAGGRIGMPEAMNKNVFNTIKTCFKKVPDARPTFADLSSSFAIFLREGAMGAAVRDIGKTVKEASPLSGTNTATRQHGARTVGKQVAKEEETYYYSKGR